MKKYKKQIVAMHVSMGFMSLLGCAEQSHIIDPNDGYQVVSLAYDGADCVEGDICNNAFNAERDIYKAPFEGNLSSDGRYPSGYFGYIDDGCHSIRAHTGRPDIDVIGADVKPGVPLRVVVSNTSMQSGLNPVVYLLDSTGSDLLFSTNTGNSIESRLSFLAPTPRFYLTVESSDNDDANGAVSCVDGETHHGGEKYGYAITIDAISESELVKSFGTISNAKQYHTGIGDSSGASLYYKARVPEGMDLRVDLSTTSSGAYPTISPINRQDWYRWVFSGESLKGTFDASTLRATATVLSEYADSEGYLWFVVSDFNSGRGYNFTLTVTPI